MSIEYWLLLALFLLLVAAFSIFLFANLPLTWTLCGEIPTANYLGEAFLTQINYEKLPLDGRTVKARDLFDESPVLVMAVRRAGCALCRREVTELSKASAELTSYGVRLIGVVHEVLGTDEFRKFLHGDLYYDPAKRFFGPKQRWMPKWWGYLRISTYKYGKLAHDEGYTGNNTGDGSLLGGVYLIHKDRVLYGHLENGWGDMFDPKEVLAAAKQITSTKKY